MRRFMAVVLVLGGTLFLSGLINARVTRQNTVVADDVNSDGEAEPAPVAVDQASTNVTSNIDGENSPFDDNTKAIFPDAEQLPPSRDETSVASEPRREVPRSQASPSQRNRFDRGRLNEEFDGELFKSRGTREVSATAEQIAQLNEDIFVEVTPQVIPKMARKSEPDVAQLSLADDGPTLVTPEPRTGNRPAIQSGESTNSRLIPLTRPRLTSDAPTQTPTPFTRPPTAVFGGDPLAAVTHAAARVTLYVAQDHQIRIVAEGNVPPDLQQIPVGTLVISAETFQLNPSNAPGTENQLTCAGRVQLRSQQFTAEGAKLSVHGNDLILEGAAKSKAMIVKQASGDESDFHLTADKISFTLSLDKIQIGNGVTVSPVVPNLPQPAAGRLNSIDDDSSAPDVPSKPIPKTPTPFDEAPGVPSVSPRTTPKLRLPDLDDDVRDAPTPKPLPVPEYNDEPQADKPQEVKPQEDATQEDNIPSKSAAD